MKKEYDYKSIEERLKQKCESLERNIKYEAPEKYLRSKKRYGKPYLSDGIKTALSAAAAALFIIGLYAIIVRMNNFTPPLPASETEITEAVTGYPINDESVIANADPDQLPSLLLGFARGYGSADEFLEDFGEYYDKLVGSDGVEANLKNILDAWNTQVYESARDPGAADEIAAMAICEILKKNSFTAVSGKSVEGFISGLEKFASSCGMDRIYERYAGETVQVVERGKYYSSIYKVTVKQYDGEDGYIERIEYVMSFDVFEEEYPLPSFVLKYYGDMLDNKKD